MGFSIRPATKDDSEVLSRICLLTANYGTSAEHLHHFGELPGVVYALPYVTLPTTFGFVLVSNDDNWVEQEVVGYTLGTWDTPAFNAAAEADWYPRWRAKYPLEVPDDPNRTDGDKHYISLVHKPQSAPKEILEFSRAHIHINLLPQAQRQGWGKKLIGEAVKFLSNNDPEMKGHWVGVDPRNEGGKKFYRKIGGTDFLTTSGEYFAFKFSEWKD